MSLAENLQFLRAREGITQEQLAERMDVSRQSVSKWESGASFPEMDTLLKLCDMFHTDMDTLLRGSVEQSLSEDAAGYDRFMTSYARKVAGSVSAIIAGAALMILLDLRIGDISGAVFMLVVAIVAVVLVASGMEEDNFRKQHPVITDIMILATALFLFLGLSYDSWESAAVIYPVGGVICGGAWLLLGPKLDV